MNRKRILIIILLCTFSSLINAENSKYIFPLENWEIDSIYKNGPPDEGESMPFYKTIKQIPFVIPDNIDSTFYYLNVYNSGGFSKIYLNGKLIQILGSKQMIQNISQTYKESFRIPVNPSQNIIKIVNYFRKSDIPTTFTITDDNTNPFHLKLYQVANESLSIVYALVTLLLLFTFFLYKNLNTEKLDTNTIKLLIFFILYFISKYLDGNMFPFLGIGLFSNILAFIAWYYLLTHYSKKHNLWSVGRTTLILIITLGLFVIFTIFYRFYTPYLGINFKIIKQVIIISTTIFFTKMIITYGKHDELFLKAGILISLLLQIIAFIILTTSNLPIFGLIQTGFMMIILSLYFNHYLNFNESIKSSDNYSEKLLDSINKLKLEISNKDECISDLKLSNDEVIREKSLFFSTLSSNLRTPLNSIIGYSENLFSTNTIEEFHPIVNEILIESDKMFQSINNIMDFSTRDFTSSDLQLKPFRMKEIFENSVYGSSTISSFKSQIVYLSEKDSDKVLLAGNPRIYQQITTSLLHLLISLNPDKIHLTISNTGITTEYINLLLKFKGVGLDSTDFNIKESFKTNKNIFSTYIKLYGIDVDEKLTDNSYEIDFTFQCALSGNLEPPTKDEQISNMQLYKNLSVLIVEDYKPNLNITKMHLTKMGCDVYTAINGEEAITIFNKEEIDIILMDIKMPIMDGWEATEVIRSSKKGLNTMIVGLTASSLDLDIKHCFESGMDDVLVKPIRKNQLFKKLNSFEQYKPEEFPKPSSLRADYRLSKFETETLFSGSVLQIKKQLEVIEMLISAEDSAGMSKEMPAIMNAALTINAFYYTRLLRNFFNAYDLKDKNRLEQLFNRLKSTIQGVTEENEELFRDR